MSEWFVLGALGRRAGHVRPYASWELLGYLGAGVAARTRIAVDWRRVRPRLRSVPRLHRSGGLGEHEPRDSRVYSAEVPRGRLIWRAGLEAVMTRAK